MNFSLSLFIIRIFQCYTSYRKTRNIKGWKYLFHVNRYMELFAAYANQTEVTHFRVFSKLRCRSKPKWNFRIVCIPTLFYLENMQCGLLIFIYNNYITLLCCNDTRVSHFNQLILYLQLIYIQMGHYREKKLSYKKIVVVAVVRTMVLIY